MDPATALTLAQAGVGVVQSVASAFGVGKANRDLAANAKLRPKYHIQQPIRDNQAIAESRASRGLNDNTLNNYNSFTERNLTASLDAILKGGGSMNNIGSLFGAAQDSERKLAILDDEMNARNVQALVQQNKEMGGELDKDFQFNQYAPWADKQRAIMARLEKNQQGVQNGINTVMSAASNYVTANQYDKENNNVYGQKVESTTSMAERARMASEVMRNLDASLQPGQNIDASNNQQPSIQEQIRMKYPGLSGGIWS